MQGNPYLSTGESEETHIATNHEDTTSGAVHCFRDEYGNWQTYTFGSDTAASSTVSVLTNAKNTSVYLPFQVGAPASSSRAIAGLINRHQRPTSTTTPRSPGSSRSSGSQDSGLTVILDSPAMVFQPGEGSREGSSGGREGREYWSRERGDLGELYTRENSRDSYWSRENR